MDSADPGQRWEALFGDLEGQLAAEERGQHRAELVDRVRGELSRLRLIDRLRPMADGAAHRVTLGITGHAPLAGAVSAVGVDWVLLLRAVGDESLVALRAVSWVRGLLPRSAEPGWEGAVGARLRLPYAVRRLSREGLPVRVALLSGDVLAGRLSRVGADHVDVRDPASGSVTVALSAIAAVHRQA